MICLNLHFFGCSRNSLRNIYLVKSWALITSVSSESEGDGDESFEEVGFPSTFVGVPQGLGELSRSTCG